MTSLTSDCASVTAEQILQSFKFGWKSYHGDGQLKPQCQYVYTHIL